jgi:hypothetical protein
MILNAADLHRGGSVFARDAPSVSVDVFLDIAVGKISTAFGAKHDVVEQIGIGVRHLL